VVGAAVAGLKTLHAANAYLPKGSRVLLIDQTQAAGSTWKHGLWIRAPALTVPDVTVGDEQLDGDKTSDDLQT